MVEMIVIKVTPELKEAAGIEAFGMSPNEARAKGICINCKEEALPKCYSDAGRRDYQLMVICETCYDAMFGED